MPHTLIVSSDIVARSMAGPGIRAWELAHALARTEQVTLAIPHASDLAAPEFRMVAYTPGISRFDQLIEAANCLVIQGLVIEKHPELLQHSKPVAIDLYDPMLLEGLDMVAGGQQDEAQALFQRYAMLNDAQLQRGDFFFCATDRQRDYWLGALTAARRITPMLFTTIDRELRELIDLVPSGVAATRPERATTAVLRGVHPAIATDDILLLWAGGLWDWFEPDRLVEAMAEVAETDPRCKLIFFAGARPSAEGAPFRTATHARALQRARDLGVLNKNVIFLEQWVPYAERGAFLAEADVGVSAHRPGIETRFAFRTRLLDYLWARLPMILSADDSFGAEIADAGAALLVAPGDTAGWVAAIRHMSQAANLRQQFQQAVEEVAKRYAWSHVAEPLIRFCQQPRRLAPDQANPYDRIAQLEAALVERDRYIQHVEHAYRHAIDHGQQAEELLQQQPSQRLIRSVKRILKRSR